MKKVVHAYDGQCMPLGEEGSWWKTFSVGVFPLVERSGGKGMKRGKVLVRVSGGTSKEGVKAVRETAERIVRLLDDGKYVGPKRVLVSAPPKEAGTRRCAACRGEVSSIGTLGDRVWFRCRACGLDCSIPAEEWVDREGTEEE